MAKLNIPAVQLNNGMSIPALGYGTWLGINKDTMDVEMKDYDKMVAALSYAIDMGYRHIDTAHLYRVEPEVGAVVRQKIQEGGVTRKDLFITTKVWNHYHRAGDVEVSARASLRRLGLTYVDLLLVHWPMSISQDGVDEKIDLLETWRGFESVLEKGLTRAIGVSNFNVDQLKRIVENCRVKPVCNQIEVNLTLGQNAIVDYCKSQDIAVVAYAPFGSMIPTRSAEGSPGPKLNDATMLAIANKHKKTVTQVALRYLYQRGIVSIPKTVTKERVVENASIFDFSLTPKEVAAIAKFDVNYPTVRQPFWQNHSNYPYPPEAVPVPEIPLCLRNWMNGANLDVE